MHVERTQTKHALECGECDIKSTEAVSDEMEHRADEQSQQASQPHVDERVHGDQLAQVCVICGRDVLVGVRGKEATQHKERRRDVYGANVTGDEQEVHRGRAILRGILSAEHGVQRREEHDARGDHIQVYKKAAHRYEHLKPQCVFAQLKCELEVTAGCFTGLAPRRDMRVDFRLRCSAVVSAQLAGDHTRCLVNIQRPCRLKLTGIRSCRLCHEHDVHEVEGTPPADALGKHTCLVSVVILHQHVFCSCGPGRVHAVGFDARDRTRVLGS